MSEQMDFTKLPYKYDPKGRHEYGIHPDLHIMLCDLAIKLPKIAYESSGVVINRTSKSDTSDGRVVGEVVVYNNEEKIGKIGVTQDYVDGKYINVESETDETLQDSTEVCARCVQGIPARRDSQDHDRRRGLPHHEPTTECKQSSDFMP
jgi:hypothetical protein